MNKPIPCSICGKAKMITNTDESEFGVCCDCGDTAIGETKDEAVRIWNNQNQKSYENMFPYGRCSHCKAEFNSEIILEYEATHCPWCGTKISEVPEVENE